VSTTAADVRPLVPDIDPATDIDWAVDDANAIVGDELIPAGLTSTVRQDLVAKYLAAHFVTVAQEKGGIVVDRMGSAQQSYTGDQQVQGLSLTRFGQQAIVFDTTGRLSNLDRARVGQAEFRVV
jgi:hypothetical protein